ncbi:MAG: bifunctional riboflavin kinase/FAD synthetase [Proteobacteria bacterium]|nr:bifunctional riboflavin kinase/FAD synthetase [Pseudomonadota bacterium]
MLVTHGSLQPLTLLENALPGTGRLAITVGNFDGVHRGHRAMLERGLTRLAIKLAVLREAGVDRVHVARFDRAFAAQSPERFIQDVLVQGLRCAWLLVGRDFRFGAKRAGDFSMLEAAAGRAGFQLEAMPEVTNSGERISSSGVRHALQQGDLEGAAALLGRGYSIAGRVAHGDKLGRELGFATANIRLPQKPPLAGIFVVEVLGVPGAGGKPWPAVASVGVRPTVKENAVPLLEAHLFDFAGDLYGRRIEVKFLHKLRDEEKYPDLDTLKDAIARDAAHARDFFAAKSHG